MSHDFIQDVYIDESYDKEVFVISFCASSPYAWKNLSIFWQAYLDETNHRLVRENRPPISRYHASDSAHSKKEFANWSQAEQISLTENLVSIVLCCPMHCFSICVVLSDLQNAMAEVYKTRLEARGLLVAAYYLAAQIASDHLLKYVHSLNGQWKFRFIYDQGPSEHRLPEAIAYLQSVVRDRFGKIVEVSASDSRGCLPLQVADFLAYESFRERKREIFQPNRARRKSLQALLAGGLGFSLRTVYGDLILEIVRENSSTMKYVGSGNRN